MRRLPACLVPTLARVGDDCKLELTGLAMLDSVPDAVFTSLAPPTGAAP